MLRFVYYMYTRYLDPTIFHVDLFQTELLTDQSLKTEVMQMPGVNNELT